MKRLLGALAVGCLIWAAASSQAKAQLTATAGLDDAWRRYLAEDTAREPSLEFPYENCFRRSAAAHDLPVTLLLAVARGESDFNSRAVSHANALGLMQILWPVTARHLGIYRRSELFRPCTNIDAGARYLKELLTHYRGNLHRSLAAYNYGPSRVPVNGTHIPKGAKWYSGYIYRHLAYVLGSEAPQNSVADRGNYSDERKLRLITFDTPYRAEAFVENLQQRAPGVRLDWFRENVKTFRVVMLYNGKGDLARSKRMLHGAGFRVR